MDEGLDYTELVHKLARKVKRNHGWIEFEDLVQEGWLGLLEAKARFDGTRGAAFETYAGHRIVGTMLDYVRRQVTGTRRYQAERVDTNLDWIASEAEAPEFGPIETARIRDAVAALTPIEQRIIVAFAQGGPIKAGYGKLATEHGLSGGRVSQLKRSAFKKIIRYMERAA
jgi:RNA polymerase sigma factor (sigma-70 family)